MARPVRCAIYTRKSSEEGLEQEFNSLDAQREACAAFIASQKHEGWQMIETTYDDGGVSGGTMERPALQRLLEDIGSRRVDVVVVYKVDRLTRSLADFAKIVEIFDAHSVSFVSVTQQFNTTTSMGRLTLNVLLSFAQFEREVTGERIRDKIAASKKKGMWMGGHVPFGYDAVDRTLVVHPLEARIIRDVFDLYLRHGCVRSVKAEADRRGYHTRIRTNVDGSTSGGRPFSRGHLYRILQNPIYAGRIAHKGETYPGVHEAIIDGETWEAVQAKLTANRRARRTGANAKEPSLLAGLLVDADGNRLSPSHAVKDGKRYRYYVSRSLIVDDNENGTRGLRLPAQEVEAVVRRALADLLGNRHRLIDLLSLDGLAVQTTKAVLAEAGLIAHRLQPGRHAEVTAIVQCLVEGAAIGTDQITLTLSVDGLRQIVGLDGTVGESIQIDIPATLKRCGGSNKVIIEGADIGTDDAVPDTSLIKAVVRAHDWFDRLASGRASSFSQIAKEESVTRPYVRRLIKLAFLAPDIVEAILDGRQPVNLTADHLTKAVDLPLGWDQQRRLLGFPTS